MAWKEEKGDEDKWNYNEWIFAEFAVEKRDLQ